MIDRIKIVLNEDDQWGCRIVRTYLFEDLSDWYVEGSFFTLKYKNGSSYRIPAHRITAIYETEGGKE